MIVDGVNFNEAAIKGMPKKNFIEQTVDIFWLDRDKETRKKILERVWEEINPTEKKAE